MLKRRLTLVAIAAMFAVSSSLAMLQSARPASADQDDHWRRSAHHQRTDHDRDDRRRHNKFHANNGRHQGWNNNHQTSWNNVNGNHRHIDRDDRKPHRDPARDHR